MDFDLFSFIFSRLPLIPIIRSPVAVPGGLIITHNHRINQIQMNKKNKNYERATAIIIHLIT